MELTRRDALASLGAGLLGPAALAAIPPAHRPAPPRSTGAAFLRAVRQGDLRRVQRMLKADAALARTCDPAGRSAFALACLGGATAIAAALRATGLELDIVEAVLCEDWKRMAALARQDPASLHRAHPVGGTPVHAAALIGTHGLWRLRGLGCDQDAAPNGGSGFTPARAAMDAAEVGWARITVSDLLGNGGDANAPQAAGDSVLHGAVRRRSEVLVCLAVRKGGRTDARDAEGRTPLDLARELGWTAGVRLLEAAADLPRDHRASRFARDAQDRPVVRPDLGDVTQAQQNEVTLNSHANLPRVRELVGKDKRLVFSVSTDDELAIEASAHIGNRPLIRFHLDHGAPLSLPTAVALGDAAAIDRLLTRDPRLVHERGAHDFPVMHYLVFGKGGADIAAKLLEHGVPVDQHSTGTTALHVCARHGAADTAKWLIENGADVEAVGYRWSRDGQTPLQVAQERKKAAVVDVLRSAGARR